MLTSFNLPAENGSRVSPNRILLPAEISGNGVSFKEALSRLFSDTERILQEYSDPNATQVNIPGFAPLDKNTPAAQLAIGVGLTRIEAQLTTLLSGLEFTLKTLPQKMDSMLG